MIRSNSNQFLISPNPHHHLPRLVFKYSVKLGRKIKDYISTWVIVTECLVLMLPQAVLLVIGMTYNVEKFRYD